MWLYMSLHEAWPVCEADRINFTVCHMHMHLIYVYIYKRYFKLYDTHMYVAIYMLRKNQERGQD